MKLYCKKYYFLKMSKRLLTKKEIKNILSFIQDNEYIPKDTFNSVKNITIKKLTSQLEKIEIYPEMIEDLQQYIIKFYKESIIQPGESVGIITAQSIGEKQTQSNLNTFHRAGSSDKQPVTSKFSELLNATNNPKAPSYMIYLNGGNKSIQEVRNTVGNNLVQITLKKIAKDISIYREREKQLWYDIYFQLYEKQPKNELKYCISINIDIDILYEYKITLKDVCDILERQFNDIQCIYSPDCFATIDIFPYMENIRMDEEKLLYITNENKGEIYLEEVVQPILENSIISGIPGILNMFFVQNKNEWILETENTRGKIDEPLLYKYSKTKPIDSVQRYKLLLSQDFVDYTKTISNNVWDIYYTLGVEAARQFMIDEFSRIMEGINTCHVMLLVDKMTFNGTISSISRYTMRTEDSGPFGKASFEETLDNFMKAGVFGQEEPTTGVSASIICGKQARIGTGVCDLTMDIDKIIKYSDN